MNETSGAARRKRILVALGVICIVLAAFLGVAVVTYTQAINGDNSKISKLNSSINSTFQFLTTHFFNLQNQSINQSIVNTTDAAFVTINQINLDQAKYENQKVIVAGYLNGPYAYPFAISYYYALSSSNQTVISQTNLDANSIGVDFGNRGPAYNGSPALIVGEVRKSSIGTGETTTVYYVEEQAVLTS
jgi:hypothetical protein